MSASVPIAAAEEGASVPLSRLTCPACGCAHKTVPLAVGETARCVRCHTPLARGVRFEWDRTLAFALTGVVLAGPAALLPFVTVSKLATERVGVLFTGVGTLWEEGMRLVAVWVFVCGGLAPLLLLGTLVAIVATVRFAGGSAPPRSLCAVARAIEHWAMPEVQVLAVLVALVKLHTLVGVRIGVGFWCYVALSLMTLLAWRSFDLEAAVASRVPASSSS